MSPRGRVPLRADGTEPPRVNLRMSEQTERALAQVAKHLGIQGRPLSRQAREAIEWAAEHVGCQYGCQRTEGEQDAKATKRVKRGPKRT